MLSRRLLIVLLSLAVSGALAGCQPEDKITHEKRPRVNDFKRLLGAIVPPDKSQKDQKTWAFKVMATETEIEPLAEPFYQLIRSVRFDNPDNPTWTLPPGWTEERGKDKELRFATIHTGVKGKAPELTVSFLQGEQAASIETNVIRWRGQLGLKNVLGGADLEDFYRYEPIGNLVAVVVDMVGPGGGGNTPPMAQVPPQPKVPFSYQAPDGWKETRPTSNLSALELRPVAQDKKVDITVSILPGDGGGLVANVNRWRKQVGLDELPAAQINALPAVSIGNLQGKLVDITGPAALPNFNRIVGAVLQREADAVFFKMKGRDDVVGEQRPAWESFLKSIKFRD